MTLLPSCLAIYGSNTLSVSLNTCFQVVSNECEYVFHAIIVMMILICGWKPGKIAFLSVSLLG
jgi:hypothetical protein